MPVLINFRYRYLFRQLKFFDLKIKGTSDLETIVHGNEISELLNKFSERADSTNFKAVLKCPLTEAKFSNALLKLIF